MTNYQEKHIVDLLDRMANEAATSGQTISELAYRFGSLQHLIWEARKLLDLPDYPGLDPI
jgi:hypothetical protein